MVTYRITDECCAVIAHVTHHQMYVRDVASPVEDDLICGDERPINDDVSGRVNDEYTELRERVQTHLATLFNVTRLYAS